MAPKITLHYWTLPSRGEFIRFILYNKNIEFNEVNYTFDDIPAIKANEALFPMGQVPTIVLENGDQIFQSHAIVRYLANEYDLYGKTNMDKAIIDQVLDTLKEIEEKCRESMLFSKGEDQQQKYKILFGDTAPRALRFTEKCLKRNNNGKGYLVGESLSIGDIALAVAIESLTLLYNKDYRNVMDDFPLLMDLNKKVREAPGIKEYLQKRGQQAKYPPFPVPE